VTLETPAYLRTDTGLRSATRYASDWRSRYAEAYRRQAKAFLGFVRSGVLPAGAADSWDGYCAAIVAEAGVRALREDRRVAVEMIRKPTVRAALRA
jgi:myo-inositol 2-dehydrogenase/D-chiro-inositol 1-dehydrogenase